MASIKAIKNIVDAEVVNGASRVFTWRKTPSQVSTAGVWFDLSMSPGNPNPQYYAAAPLISKNLSQSTDGGIFHGSNVTPKNKYLLESMHFCTTATALPLNMILCDYLLYYPFIDEGTTDEQLLTNDDVLTRYTDGAGVQIMAVSVASRTGGQSFYVNYTNQDGVPGRITKTVIQNTATANGHIVSSQNTNNDAAGPFLPLQEGDTGVRSIESVTMLGADVGLFTLVLVKPLAYTDITSITAPVEVNYVINRGGTLPNIKDDAYLNYICLPLGSLSGSPIHGTIKTIFY